MPSYRTMAHIVVKVVRQKPTREVWRFTCDGAVPSYSSFSALVASSCGDDPELLATHRLTHVDCDGDVTSITSDATLTEAWRQSVAGAMGDAGTTPTLRLEIVLKPAPPLWAEGAAEGGAGLLRQRKRARCGGLGGGRRGGGRRGRGGGDGVRRERRHAFLVSLTAALGVSNTEAAVEKISAARRGDADARGLLRDAMDSIWTPRPLQLKLLLGIERHEARALLAAARGGDADAAARVRATLGDAALAPRKNDGAAATPLPRPIMAALAFSLGISNDEVLGLAAAWWGGDAAAQQRLMRAAFHLGAPVRIAIAGRCKLRDARRLCRDAKQGDPRARATYAAIAAASAVALPTSVMRVVAQQRPGSGTESAYAMMERVAFSGLDAIAAAAAATAVGSASAMPAAMETGNGDK